jgi:hypothetical protein
MSQPDFNPFDPISAAMGAMHGQNLLAAKDARIKQLEGRLEALQKAGDIIAFHYTALGRKVYGDDPLPSSIIDWQEARNHG